MTTWIGAAEAARRLGIKPASLYSYVSRGVLTRRRGADGRGSLFDAGEVETLARRGRPRRAGTSNEMVIETALTEITEDQLRFRGLDALELAVRCSFEEVAALLWTGHLHPPVPAAAPNGGAAPLTGPAVRPGGPPPARGAPASAGGWQATGAALAVARAAQAALPESTLPLERLQVIVPAMAATDPLRLHLDPPAVVAAARAMIAGMTDSLPPARSTPGARVPGAAAAKAAGADAGRSAAGAADVGGSQAGRAEGGVPEAFGAETAAGAAGAAEAGRFQAGAAVGGAAGAFGAGVDAAGVSAAEAGGAGAGRTTGGSGSIAARLAARLSPQPLGPGLTGALRAALVLLADHELAASTLAVRVAASMRADPYAVVAAGLGAVGGALHGGASLGAEQMLAAAAGPQDAAHVVGELLRRGERIPGFGHFVYRSGDPRAMLLLRLTAEAAPESPRLAVARAVLAEASRRALPEPNIDFALATLTGVAGMIPGASEAVFAVARTAGWLAHAMEEYALARPIRPRGVYTGPTPA